MARSWIAAVTAGVMAAFGSVGPSQAAVAPASSSPSAEDLIGRTVLIGITFLQPGGTVSRQEQMYGEVEAVTDSGVMVRLAGAREGEEFWLPPQLEAFERAPPGDYRLRSTGETVRDPDFTTTWTMEPPAS